MRWWLAIPVIALVNGFASGFVGLLAFGVLMMFGDDHPLGRLVIALMGVFFFPYMIAEAVGLSPGRFDGAPAVVFNSLCWAAVVYPVWQVTRPWRTAIARRAAGVWGRFAARVLATIGFTLFGLMAGYLGLLFTTAMQSHTEDGVEAVSVRVLGVRVHDEVGPAGETFDRVRHHWLRVVPRWGAVAGTAIGLGLGLLATRPRRPSANT
jgi:hypothetical protein